MACSHILTTIVLVFLGRLASVAVVLVAMSACSDGSLRPSDTGVCETERDLVVLAASSLAAALPELEPDFLTEHPCIDAVRFSFGSSATLAAQVVNGAPVDVLITASTTTMERVVGENLAAGQPVEIARNSAALVVSGTSSYARSISDLVDLLDDRNPGVKVGLCAPSVPCGALADEVLANAASAYGEPRLVRSIVGDTEASSAEDLVTKVRLGELDAGIAYASDCGSGRDVQCVEIPSEVSGVRVNSSTSVSAVAVSAGRSARDFVEFLASGDVRARLVADFGFGAP